MESKKLFAYSQQLMKGDISSKYFYQLLVKWRKGEIKKITLPADLITLWSIVIFQSMYLGRPY